MRLRIKLAVICALAATAPLIALSILIVRQSYAAARTGKLDKLESEARAAESIYEKRLIEMRSAAQGLADEIAAKSLLEQGAPGRNGPAGPPRSLQDFLARARDELSLDFIIVADANGQVIARHNDSPKPGETLVGPAAKNALAEEVISGGSRLHVVPLAGSVVERGEFLSRMWLDKAAAIQNAPATGALVVESAAPIISPGRFLGLVLAGQLVNNSYKSRLPASNKLRTPVVTEAQMKLYPGVDGAGAVVALGDTIVASSVLPSAPSDPLLVGSRHESDKSYEVFTLDGQQYAVSWRPFKSMDGNEICAIGAVITASGQTGSDLGLITTLGLATLATALLVGLAGGFWGGTVSRRLAVLSDAVSRMRVGELSTAIRDTGGLPGWVPGLGTKPTNGSHQGNGYQPQTKDEIEELAENLDRMRESFKQAIERLRKNR